MKIFLSQDHPISAVELAMIALGHTALGFIIGLGIFGG